MTIRSLLRVAAASTIGRIVIAVAGLLGSLGAYDRVGAPTRVTGGTVTGEGQTWSMKRHFRCRVHVQTPGGDVTDRYQGKCRGAWKPGEAVTLEIVYGRLTGRAVVGGSLQHRATP